MNPHTLINQLEDAMAKHQHYTNKGWYKIAWRYWNKTVCPLMDKLEQLNNKQNEN